MSNLTFRSAFVDDESGAGTEWWVLWMFMFMVMGGVAVDSSNAWRMRAQLQFTADAAAHAAVIDLPNEAAAAATAASFATNNMNATDHGNVLAASEIEIGIWDSDLDQFFLPTGSGGGGSGATGGSAVTNAVRITTRRDASNLNRLRTSFLQLIGMDSWSINTQAVAERYFPGCTNTDGLFARHVVDLQSNNLLRDGICIHGNDHVSLNNNNVWEAGVSVTMPNLENLSVPSSDIDVQNPGLADALGEEYFDPKIVDQIGDIVASLQVPGSPYWPSYIGTDSLGNTIPDSDVVVTIAAPQFHADTAEQGHVYHVTCPGNSLLVLGATGLVLSNMVIIADCRIYTGQNTLLQDVMLISTAGDARDTQQYPKAINVGNSNQLGADDGCATTGNVKLFSTGGSIKSAADVQAYGLQAVAVHDISLTAHAQGLEGILLQAGNDVSITSNNSFGSTCPDLGAIQVPYFRLVL